MAVFFMKICTKILHNTHCRDAHGGGGRGGRMGTPHVPPSKDFEKLDYKNAIKLSNGHSTANLSNSSTRQKFTNFGKFEYSPKWPFSEIFQTRQTRIRQNVTLRSTRQTQICQNIWQLWRIWQIWRIW